MSDLTIKQLVEQSYQNSADHGFWDHERTDETIPNKLMLTVSELSEALEDYRDPTAATMVKVPADVIHILLGGDSPENSEYAGQDRMAAMDELERIYNKWLDKPKGFNTEIADAFIRLGDLCGALGIDIEEAIQTKHEFNKGRPRMHGRKV